MKLVEHILTKNPCYTAGRKITVKGLMLHSVGCPQPSASAFLNADKHSHASSVWSTKRRVRGMLMSVYVFVIFICNFSLKPIDSGEYKGYNYDRKNKIGQNVLEVITWRLLNRKMK